MNGVGVTEILIILVLGLLLFGPKKIPEIAKTLGEAVREFRKFSSPTYESQAVRTQRDEGVLIGLARGIGIDIEGKTQEDIIREIMKLAKPAKSIEQQEKAKENP